MEIRVLIDVLSVLAGLGSPENCPVYWMMFFGFGVQCSIIRR
jgi:hypothetical protein